MTINFKRQQNGSTLATAVLIVDGVSTPRFYRMHLDPEVDPWDVYSQVAARALAYIQDREADTIPPTSGKDGRLVQLKGVLPLL